jgi:pimeloyl-ACP methyl ester carboxylesterase
METLCHLNTADHASVAYRRRRGEAALGRDPLLLIHGAASNMTRWSEFVERTALTATHDVIRLDLRGHGESLYRGRIGLEVWCDDIAALLRQEGRGRAILMGHCLGANVAMMFAARYPQHARGVVLVEPMLHQALVGTLGRLSRMTMPLRAVIAMIRMFNRLGVYRRRLAALDLYELDKLFRDRLGEPGGDAAFVRRYASPWHDLKTMPSANFLQDLLEVVRPLPLDKIRAPFLALLSTGRTFVDPGITAALLSGLPQGEVHALEAKHWIPTEQPRAMRELVEAWVTALRM